MSSALLKRILKQNIDSFLNKGVENTCRLGSSPASASSENFQHPMAMPIEGGPPMAMPIEEGCASSSSSVSESSDETRSSEDSEGEIYPESFKNIKWILSKGPKGHLHLSTNEGLPCSRKLHRPECGHGLSAALETGRDWSPRCFARLQSKAQEWWKASSSTTSS